MNTRIALIKVAAFAMLIGPGLIMIIGPITPFMSWVNAFLDLAYQPFDHAQKVTESTALLLNAILGGVLIGFGVMIWMVAEHVYRDNQALGRKIIIISILSWFITDCAGSIIAGAWFNAIINTVLLLTLIAPLFWPSKA